MWPPQKSTIKSYLRGHLLTEALAISTYHCFTKNTLVLLSTRVILSNLIKSNDMNRRAAYAASEPISQEHNHSTKMVTSDFVTLTTVRTAVLN